MCSTFVPFLNYLIIPHDADDVNETSSSGSRQVVEDCITSTDNLVLDGATNVVIEVTTNNASLSKNNLSLDSSSTKVVIEDNLEVSGFNKDLDGSNFSETYSSSIQVCHSDAFK